MWVFLLFILNIIICWTAKHVRFLFYINTVLDLPVYYKLHPFILTLWLVLSKLDILFMIDYLLIWLSFFLLFFFFFLLKDFYRCPELKFPEFALGTRFLTTFCNMKLLIKFYLYFFFNFERTSPVLCIYILHVLTTKVVPHIIWMQTKILCAPSALPMQVCYIILSRLVVLMYPLSFHLFK